MRSLAPLLLATACCLAGDPPTGNGYQQVAEDHQRPILGVEMTPPATHVLDREGLGPNQGVQVQSVYNGTAASAMGLRKDDIILSVNDAPIGSMTDLRNEVGLSQVGDPVGVTVIRDGTVVSLRSELKPWPEHIPYKPLDAAAERRFRDWQDRRNGRLSSEAQALRKDIEEVRRELSDEVEDAVGPGEAGSADAGLGLPAFRLSLRVPSVPVPVVEADDLGPLVIDPLLADPTGTERPWRAAVRVEL